MKVAGSVRRGGTWLFSSKAHSPSLVTTPVAPLLGRATPRRLRFSGRDKRVAPFGSLSSTTRGTSTDSRRYRRLSTLDLNRASEAAAFATMCVWRLVGATVPLHPRFGADQKPKRSCSLRASKNRSRHRVTAFGVWTFVHMSPSCASCSTSSSAFLNTEKPSTPSSSLFLKPFDFQDRIYRRIRPAV